MRLPRIPDAPAVPPGIALLPLRLFLGGTFVYAGIEKLTDPGFLAEGAPTYIGSQLEAFADGTPGGLILRTFAEPIPEFAGVGVALAEIVIGLLAFFGLLTRAAAVAGVGLSVLLFLTASWKTRPYFLGPDLVFAFAWLPFVLTGASGQPALDHVTMRELRLRRRPEPRRLPAPAVERGDPLTRRAFVAVGLGATGAFALIAAAGASLTRGTYKQPAAGAAGVEIPGATALAPGDALVYQGSAGTPNVLIKAEDGSFAAFSALCTHGGCEVAYQSGSLVCPCHGGVFNAQTGAVEAGPPPTPLPARTVEERDGSVFAT
jgi:thiosulfate dehydrogenase [quinone] large subunit